MFYGSGMLDWGDKTLDSIYSSDVDVWEGVSPTSRILNPEKKPLNYLRHDYIFGMIKIKTNDYLNIGTSYMFGADDQSGLLTAFLAIEPLEAFDINISCLYPFDWKMINTYYPAGEFGSTNLGFYQMYQIEVKVKF
jgi:hypothetical protein